MGADATMPILVVDDYQTMVRVTRGQLKQIGFDNVDDAPDGLAALAMIRAKRYRLVISDSLMEPLTGMALFHALRNEPNAAATRFMLSSSDSKTDGMIATLRAGVDGYLVRPFKPSTLKAKIDRIFDA